MSFTYYSSLVLIALIFSVGIFYVFQITSSVTAGLKNYKQTTEINQLKLANQLLDEKVNSLENLDLVKERALKLGLVAVKKVEYLEDRSKEMAVVK